MDRLKNIHIVIISGNSVGLENDAKVMQVALKKHYPSIHVTLLLGREPTIKKYQAVGKLCIKSMISRNLIFIHMEELQSRLTWLAKQNYLIPNQEWFRSLTEKNILANQHIHLLCKTEEAMRAFADLSERTHYLGFSSINRYLPKADKNFNQFLHLAGKSKKKGTMSIIDAWKKHPHWPCLTLRTSVDEYITHAKEVPNIKLITEELSQRALHELMNSHGVHLCVSEMEGFGHYIVEALSTGAVVVTTNAAPMNELVTKQCGFLVECKQSYQQYRGRGFHLIEQDFAHCIDNIIQLDNSRLGSMSNQAYIRYTELTNLFEKNIGEIFDQHLISL